MPYVRFTKFYPTDDQFISALEVARKLKMRGDLFTGEDLLTVICYALSERDSRAQHPLASQLQNALMSGN